MTEGSYRSGAETQTRSEVHCGQPMIELNEHRACGKCGGFFRLDKGKLHAVDKPDGLRLDWQIRDGIRCRIVAEDRLSPSASWLARLLGAVLMFMGAVATAQLLRPAADPPNDVILTGVATALLGAAVYFGTVWGALRTAVVDVTSHHLDVHRGPLSWSTPTRLQRTGTELRVQLVPGYSAQVVSLRLRWPSPTRGMSWPTGERYQVQLVSDDHAPTVLLDSLPSFAAAERARLLVARVLTATAPRWRVDTRDADEDRDDEPLSTARTSRAKRR